MATLLAHIQVKPGREADFEAIAARLHRETHAREPGVLRYEYWRGARPGFYYSLLSFSDFLAFLAHQTSDHHEAASPELGDLVEDLKLEWVDPVAESSPLPHTDMQPLPEQASELEQRYHGLFAAVVQEWWGSLRR